MLKAIVASSAILLAGLFTPVAAQTVSFDDLKGKTISMTRTEMRRIRTAARGEADQEVQQSWTITVAPSGSISTSTTVYVDNKGGRKGTRTWSASSVTLGKPYAFRDGQSVMVFDGGALNIMRTLQTGGGINKVTFSRGASGLTCMLSGGLARENGKGDVKLGESGAVFDPAEVLSAKITGTSCRVS